MLKHRALVTAIALILSLLTLPAASAAAAPAAPVVTGYPQGAVGARDAAFSFYSAGADEYQCRVFPTGDTPGSYATCTGVGQGYHTVSDLVDGDWTFEVRAGQAGDFGAAASRDWTVTSDPIVQWIVEPSGSYSTRFVTATFSAPGATSFQCRIVGDPADFTSCGSGQQGFWTSPQLADGDYQLQVKAADAGGFGPVATATFTVAAGSPIVWVSKPSGTYGTRFVTATFRSAAATEFQCRVYRTDPQPDPLPDLGSCGSGRQGFWASTELADGAYELQVQSSDAAGSGPVASASFTVAAGGPAVWVSRPSGTYDTPTVTATFRSAAATGFQCRVYRTDPQPDPLPDLGSCGSGRQGFWTSSPLANGDYRLEVRAEDSTGPRPAVSTTFTVAVPLVTQWVNQPTGTITGDSVAATFRADLASNFECRLEDEPDFSACGSGAQGYFTATPGLGTHTLLVRARSAQGDVGPVASTSFTLAANTGTGLDVAVTAGPVAGSTISSAWAAFAWSAPDASCYQVAFDVDLPAGNGCTTYSTVAQYSSLADGPHTLRVRAVSIGGTPGPATVHPFTVDTAGATSVAVTSGPVAGSTISSAWAAFAWSAPDASCYQVAFDVDLPAGNGCTTYSTVAQYSSLADGPHTLRVRAVSIGGTPGPATVHPFTVDTAGATSVAVTSGPVAGSTISSAWAAFAWSAPDASCYQVAFDVDLPAGNGCTTYSTVAQYSSLADGPHTLRVRAVSIGGTPGPATVHPFTVDTAGGTSVAVTSGPVAGSTISSAWAAFAWSAPDASCYQVAFDVDLPAGNGCTTYSTVAQYSSLADGPHTLRVRAVSIGGTPGPATVHPFTVNGGPWVTVSSRPRQVLPSGTSAFAWSAPDASCYQVALDVDLPAGNGCTTYSTVTQYSSLADGPHTLRVRAVSIGGTPGPAITTTFTVETKAPQTTITASPPAYHNSTTAAFEFTADEPATFTCSIDGATPVPCTSPWTRTGLAPGEHTVAIRATDLFGNPDPTPATADWTVDTRAPRLVDLTLNGLPESTSVITTGDATLAYTFDEPVASYACRLTPQTTPPTPALSFQSCTNTKNYPDLDDGTYTFEVTATDQAGNVSDVASRTFTVVTVAPQTVITDKPGALVNMTTATITFASPDSPVTFECKLDNQPQFAACPEMPLTALGQGPHTFQVRAVKGGVLPDPTPAEATWTVDSIAPVVTITGGPTGTVGIGASVVSFEAVGEPAGVTFTCALDANLPKACSSPTDASTLGLLLSGSHTFTVFGTDLAGNESETVSRTWEIDAVAPVVTITSSPPDPTNDPTGTVTFTVDDDSATVECKVDDEAWAACTSPYTTASLGDGSHTVTVRATDPAGNQGNDSATWTVDTTPPTVELTSSPPATIRTTSAEFGFTTSEPATTECRVDAGPWVPCSSPTTFADLPQGQRTVQIRATDLAGNTGPWAEGTVIVDTVAPTVTITSGPIGTVPVTDATITFTTDDPTATTQCRLDTAVSWGPCASPFERSGLGEGSHILRVRATDSVGNIGLEATREWTVDTVEPDTRITDGPPALTNQTTASITFESDPDGADFECSVDGAAFESCTSAKMLTGLSDGPHSLRVRAVSGGFTDPTPAERAWNVDTSAPVLAVTGKPTGTTTVADSRFIFTVDDPEATVACQLDTGAWATCTSPFDPQPLSDGLHNVSIRATDTAGNTTTEGPFPWTVDGTPPDVIITSGPVANSTVTTRTVTFTFTVNDPTATVQCRIDSVPVTCEPGIPVTVGPLDDGPHTFSVQATDPAGNPGGEGRIFNVDATAPKVQLTGGPTGATTSATAAFTLTVDDPDADPQCRLDSTDPADWGVCPEPLEYTVAEGGHTLEARATDPHGNVGYDKREWTVDLTAPTVTITSGPSGTVGTSDVTFTFTASEQADFECRLDSTDPADWAPCTPGPDEQSYTDLGVGGHLFEVQATDLAGLTSAVVEREFTVEILGTPDLQVEVSARSGSGDPLATTGLGDDFLIRAAVTNTGDAAAQNTAVTVPLSADFALVGALPPGCTSPDQNGPVTCNVGTVAVNATESVDIPVHAVLSCTIVGDSADNKGLAGTIAGTPGNDVICGGAGADEILGRGGQDVVWGNGPTGTITTGGSAIYDPGALKATAPSPASVLIDGPDGGDTITTVTGTDIVYGQGGNDRILTGGGLDTVEGGDGDDIIETGSGNSKVTGGPGDDMITGGNNVDDVDGGPGGDSITVLGGNDTKVLGGPGIDIIDAGSGSNIVDGGTEGDTITTLGGADTVTGGDGPDTIRTGDGFDTVDGGDGADIIETGSGNSKVTGGPGDDMITGGNNVDDVDGGPGADTISVLGGADMQVFGGEGDDRITAGTGANVVRAGPGHDAVTDSSGQVFGEDGNDTITGTAAPDTIEGGPGDDTIDAAGGNDTGIRGDEGADTIHGGTGSDILDGGDGNDSLFGDLGNDTLRGGPGDDPVLDGGDGADTVRGNTGNDGLLGGIDADALYGGPGNDTVDGQTGSDSVYGDNFDDAGPDCVAADGAPECADDGDDTVRGGPGNDKVVNGQGGRDYVYGDDGSDPLVLGGSGDDYLVDGGAGVDSVYGADGDDTVRGGPGNDTVVNGQSGKDNVYGDDGNDPLVLGGDGDDQLVDGGAGVDSVYGGPGNDVEVRGGPGNDTVVNGQEGNDSVYGDDGNDYLLVGDLGDDTLYGGAGDDTLFGNAGKDELFGEAGRDILLGGEGDSTDRLLGGDSHDYLAGGDGNDYLNGQLGRDVLRGGVGDDELDGGGTDFTKNESPGDHWNRLYGDDGTADECRFGPGLDLQMTNYRDSSCELRDGVATPGEGWLQGTRDRLDRGATDPATYPG